jgi:hypothetical protein
MKILSTSPLTPRTPNLKIITVALLCILQRLESFKVYELFIKIAFAATISVAQGVNA